MVAEFRDSGSRAWSFGVLWYLGFVVWDSWSLGLSRSRVEGLGM